MSLDLTDIRVLNDKVEAEKRSQINTNIETNLSDCAVNLNSNDVNNIKEPILNKLHPEILEEITKIDSLDTSAPNDISFKCDTFSKKDDKEKIPVPETQKDKETTDTETDDSLNENDVNISTENRAETDDYIDESEDLDDNSTINTENHDQHSNESEPMKHFTQSTHSLNDNDNTNQSNNFLCNSTMSKSAENIPYMEANHETRSTESIDTNQVIAEFTNKKIKVSATQKITSNNPEPLLNTQHSKLNKEIIAQDLGYLVKNVHGLFSSVSGSLKSAYNISQKASNQFIHPSSTKPAAPSKPPVVNGRIVEEIFDERNEPDRPISHENGIAENPVSSVNADIIPEVNHLDNTDDNVRSISKCQLDVLDRVLYEQRQEIAVMKERMRQQNEELRERGQSHVDMERKMNVMCKRMEQAIREKDAAVMRYASVECATIEAKKSAEAAQKTEKNALAEVELLNNKIKAAHAEKQRICQLYDNKCHELLNLERELAKCREDTKELDGRLKWTQSKLRLEIDVNKECSERAERLAQQVAELEAAKEVAVSNAEGTLRAKQLESDIKESQASLILCRHEKTDLERRFTTTHKKLEVCKRDLDETTRSLSEYRTKAEQLAVSNMRLEEEAASLASLRAQASLADALTVQLQRESERAAQAEEELSKERARAETCARREAAALEHSARLTASHVAASATRERAEDKAQALGADNICLREKVSWLEAEVERLGTALADETERRNKENRVLARKVAELTEESQDAVQKLEWEKGENAVLKKKHASAIKEMNRELQRALKRCEQLESKMSTGEPDPTRRAGSVSSISSGESASAATDEQLRSGGDSDVLPDIQVREPDKQALIERIVSLQRAAARRSERCDFLEEHSRQLTAELRKKSRVLRQLLCSVPAGALASKNSDENKKEIARLGGGAMAAVWGGDPAGMTLELSLEMNRRLQAVLEDTLLKNITLKENMDTLGKEIERLKEEYSVVSK